MKRDNSMRQQNNDNYLQFYTCIPSRSMENQFFINFTICDVAR